MIANCTACGCLYEFPSNEAANEPDRMCLACYLEISSPRPEMSELPTLGNFDEITPTDF
jgi:hypothetical protein